MEELHKLFSMADETVAEGVNLLADLIRFETVNSGVMPTGNELPLCQYLRDRLAKEDISSQILESAENRGNLVARLPGSLGSARLLFMGHTDVVPVENPQEWRFPPFSATVADGRIWGRGAADMKEMVAAELMALVLLRRAGVSLRGDLIVASAADEETGGKYGFGWLAENAPETIRADFAINEGGGGPVSTPAGTAYSISVGEKGRWELQITFRGRATHAASPWHGDNVSFKMGEVLRRLERWQPEINVSHEFFNELSVLLGRPEPFTVENVDALAGDLSEANPGLGSEVRGLSRMTLVPTMFSGGIKSNSVPAGCKLVCDVRTLPWQDEAYVRRQVDQLLEGIDGASYELICTAITNASAYDTRLSAAIRTATAQASGRNDLKWLPDLVTGFTDSRFIRPLGSIVYGFGPGHPGADLTHPGGVHGANESTELANLLFMTKAFIALALELLK
ncbi:MAG: M20/M25/M40 family metallo-hydrolase [Anaerolineaceae bacterium]|nr:M20/M25/M40 family metallo-hydrolase [Anaerolineaceae bacterium]